jgi:hypothetical protein
VAPPNLPTLQRRCKLECPAKLEERSRAATSRPQTDDLMLRNKLPMTDKANELTFIDFVAPMPFLMDFVANLLIL